ncbi:diguanylate cyclase (GGDEF)-like protein [Sphingomonas sp. PvP055]|uniref:putative bifunctional diguanylate cyclase/phosphodiesterase n=1 Tax=Sphingomonas sp. PvP055 TaxID=3156391 RepID=UPI003397D6F3
MTPSTATIDPRPSPLHQTLARQVQRARLPDGGVDLDRLLALVSETYAETDVDRRRTDRANRLMAEELEEALSKSALQNVRFKAALDNMNQGLALFDPAGRLVLTNQRFLDIYRLSEAPAGLTLDQTLERSPCLSIGTPTAQRRLIREYHDIASDPGAKIEQRWPDGRTITIERNQLVDGGFLDTVADVTEARNASAQIAHLARHDALTDLPNRTLLHERLAEMMRNARRGDRCAMLCLDLDRFKLVNDTLGHPVGDALLVAVADRLVALVRPHDVVARLGGDEFSILVQHVTSDRVVKQLCRRIIETLTQPFEIAGHHIQIGASVGVAMGTVEALDPDTMLRDADLALYRAKRDGRGNYRFYTPDMHVFATRRRELEIELRRALNSNEFEVHYQPQINIETQTVVGFEALARWYHPERGVISPGEFISVCEEIGLIGAVGEVILMRSCHDAACWPENVKIAVNLSAVQFKSGTLPALVARALRDSGLDPRRLELEITESVMLEDTASVITQLKEIKRLGVLISLDDFGTGYSSLSHIRNFPFDRVKIDQSFVRELGTNSDSLAIVRAVTGLCSSLGIMSIAEGVETLDQLNILAAEKCDSAQGYYYSRPVPLAETGPFVSRMAALHAVAA